MEPIERSHQRFQLDHVAGSSFDDENVVHLDAVLDEDRFQDFAQQSLRLPSDQQRFACVQDQLEDDSGLETNLNSGEHGRVLLQIESCC